jgi:predicted dehydrogenase
MKTLGLGIVGCGRIGRIRAEAVKDYPGVRWLGLCDKDGALLAQLGSDVGSAFTTQDLDDLLARPELDALIIATSEDAHGAVIDKAVQRGVRNLLIEKPLATDPSESAHLLASLEAAGTDAVVGYTQRFRRRFIVAKDKIERSRLGTIRSVSVKAYLNRLIPQALFERLPAELMSPMVLSGTHALDLCCWLLGGKRPVEVYARSVYGTAGTPISTESTMAIITFDDGSLCNLDVCWALPEAWPASVYGMDLAIVGTDGALWIDDTHRDIVMTTTVGEHAAYTPGTIRNVDFLGSYLPGEYGLGRLWGPMWEETRSWLSRLEGTTITHHATAREAHANLVLSMAIDRSAYEGQRITLAFD